MQNPNGMSKTGRDTAGTGCAAPRVDCPVRGEPALIAGLKPAQGCLLDIPCR